MKEINKTYRVYILSDKRYRNDPLNNRWYIGYTGDPIELRIKRHYKEAKYSKRQSKKLSWLRSMTSVEDIEYVIIKDNILTIEEAWETEVYHIQKFKDCGGRRYLKNTTKGGKGGGPISPEAMERMKEASRNRKQSKESIDKRKATVARLKAEGKYGWIKKTSRFDESGIIDIFKLHNYMFLTPKHIAEIYKVSIHSIDNILYSPLHYTKVKEKHSLSLLKVEGKKRRSYVIPAHKEESQIP